MALCESETVSKISLKSDGCDDSPIAVPQSADARLPLAEAGRPCFKSRLPDPWFWCCSGFVRAASSWRNPARPHGSFDDAIFEGSSMASYQYIYVMKGLSKAYPGGKEILKDVWLSFLPGAKIGVLGPNGAGKSTLLKIMAGVDKEFNG